jgi:hypothetical protein
MTTKITDAACTFDRMVSITLAVTDHYAFSLAVSRTDSSRSMACDTQAGTSIGATCTSTWTLMVTRHTLVDAGL